MEPFVIDETHTSLGWRLHSPSLASSLFVAERSDANVVLEVLNAGVGPFAAAEMARKAEAEEAEAAKRKALEDNAAIQTEHAPAPEPEPAPETKPEPDPAAAE